MWRKEENAEKLLGLLIELIEKDYATEIKNIFTRKAEPEFGEAAENFMKKYLDDIEKRVRSQINSSWDIIKFLDPEIQKRFLTFLKMKSENYYPRVWMIKEAKIWRHFETQKMLLPFMNQMHDYHRWGNKDQTLKARAREFEELTGKKGRNSQGKFISWFITNNDFWNSMVEKINHQNERHKITKSTCYRYFNALLEAEVYFQEGKNSKFGRIFSDGWFMKTGDGKFKKSPYVNKMWHGERFKTLF